MTVSSNNEKKSPRVRSLLAAIAIFLATLSVTLAKADSHARIVRLSEVQGSVAMSQGAGEKLSRAFINLPLVEGSHVRTGTDGRAEVEFEDGSTLRLGPDTEINFSRLTLADNGSKMNTAQLLSGMVYANVRIRKVANQGADQFVLSLGRDSIAVPDAAHLRLVIDGSNHATLAVFRGKVNATLPSGQFEVSDKHSAGIKFSSLESSHDDFGSTAATEAVSDNLVVSKNYQTQPSDDWDREQNEYHDRNASTAAARIGSPYAYGMSDLNYYGNFMSVPGYGNVWQPYFAGANWSPFQDGGWAFSPGVGYNWVSGYQWGWMPYHYGTWAFASGYGWFWQPGLWNSYAAMPQVVNAPSSVKIPTAPIVGRRTTVVGRGLTANPPDGTVKVMTIAPGSGGFGVPRGSIDHLNHIAKKMEHNPHPITVAAAAPPSLTQSSQGFPQSSARGMLTSAASPHSNTHQPPIAPPRAH